MNLRGNRMDRFEIAPKETERKLNWHEAKMYCFSLNVDGIVGWRLPTIKELQIVYENDHDFEMSWYWTSDPVTRGTVYDRDYPEAINDDYAKQIYMKFGEDDIDHKTHDFNWVRPGRDYKD